MSVSQGKGNPSLSKSSPTSTRKVTSKETASSNGKRAKQTSGRKQYASPPRHGVSGNKASLSRNQTGRAKSVVKGSDDKRQEATNAQELTKSGLKIIDWSGQGITSIPFNLVTAKEVGHLILSSNNMRSVPTEITRMKRLEKLNISKNGIRCASSNDFSGLPEEMVQLTNLTELCISECNLPFIPPAIFRMTCLRILDVSRNKINILPPEIGQLVNLVKLNLQQMNISSLPPEIAYCQELEELYLWGNSIETLPETLSEMFKLRVLALNYKSFCGVVDPYMENLLRKGQINSEHIPMAVFELAALEVLDLENTKLNTLPDLYNNVLKELYLCKNFLQIIPSSIYDLGGLRVLDMSNNLLSNLPEDIGHLKGLRVLRLATNHIEAIPLSIGSLTQLEEFDISQNKIRRIPPEIKGLTALQMLILAKNQIQTLPDEICELTQLKTLDLTDNEIHSLPMAMYNLTRLTVAHSFHKFKKCGLWLYKNPLEQPPPEVWRSEKPDNIFEYLKKLVTFKTENLQRQKILLFGESQCGKTSLARALTLRKSMLTRGPQDKTRLLCQTMWKTDNKVALVVNDFGGDDVYRLMYRMFLDNKAIVLLVYNAATLSEGNFHNDIGRWLDMLGASIPGAVVKVVGTQLDLLHPNVDKDGMEATPANKLRTTQDSTDNTENGMEATAENGLRTNQDSTDNAENGMEATAENGLRTNQDSTDNAENGMEATAENGMETTAENELRTNQDSTDNAENGMEATAENGMETTAENELRTNQDSTDNTENEGGESDMNPQQIKMNNGGLLTIPEAQHKEKVQGLVSRYLKSQEIKIREELESLESDINNMEKLEHVEMNEAELKMMRVREKKLKHIQQNPLKILPEVSLTSASGGLEGVLKLTDELEHLAIDKTLFPHAQKHIPDHWKQLGLMLKQKKGKYLHWDDAENIAELFSAKDEELRECIQHLHDTGDVLWFGDDPRLCQIIFHKPKVLVDIITSLYRHDIARFLTYDDKVFLCKGRIDRQQFQECTEIFIHRGEISRPLLKCFWFPFEFNNNDIAQLTELLPLLDICYHVPEPDVPIQPLHIHPLMVLPWCNKDTDMTLLKEIWPATKIDTDKELAVIYAFPLFCPPEIFPTLSSQLQDLVDERMDLQDYVYASRDTTKLLLYHSFAEDVLTIVIRGPVFTEVQSLMEEVVNLVNIQLGRYPGLYWRLTIPRGISNTNRAAGFANK